MFFKKNELTRKIFFICADIIIMIFSTLVAYGLRFDFEIPDVYNVGIYITIISLSLMRISFFYNAKIYNLSWRHFGFKDAIAIIYLSVVSTLLLLLVAYIVRNFGYIIPRSIIPIEFFISLFLIMFLRSAKRFYIEKYRVREDALKTIIVANLDNAYTILRTINVEKSPYNPIAIINDDKDHTKLDGLNVYSLEDFSLAKESVEVAIVDRSIDIATIYDKLQHLGIKNIKVASEYSDYGAEIKNISVKDFLARNPQDLDKTKISSFIKGKTVLITGAGGSIGSEIVRQCIMYDVGKLLLLDNSEFNLYTIEQETALHTPVTLLQSITDKEDIERTFQKYQPEVVIHAAAYKHVPLVEENISEAIVNNIIGTKNMIDLSIKYGVKKFVFVSTDKAVRPTNVMGTTKRVCELYAQNVESQSTEIVSVRFGNVLGSSGSVIPKFQAQIEKGENITVTHPDVTRYFMLIPEACELVLQAGAIGKGSEIFILDMGEPIKIVDIAKKMIEFSARDDIKIVFSGLRKGEKLYEELLIDESDAKTEYDSITVAKSTQYDIEQLNADIKELVDTQNQLQQLKKIVPEFEHRINAR